MPNNVVEEELTNLRRQVLFLQQQLEEREKTVQVLRLRIDNSRLDEENSVCEADKTQCNAATQTGCLLFLTCPEPSKMALTDI